MKRLSLLVFLALSNFAQADIKYEMMPYQNKGVTMHGYHVFDDSHSGKRPGILLVHEWWGQSDYIRNRARLLAKEGYSVLAVDLYGNGKRANNVAEAASMSGEVMSNMEQAKDKFIAAKKTLGAHSATDASQIAAIGYSFGGGLVIRMARMGVDLAGAVNFFGQLKANEKAKKGDITAKLLVLEGQSDPFITKEDIDSFKNEMDQAGVDYKLLTYPDAQHSFTNPNSDDNGKIHGLPLAYNREADEQSWQALGQFLKTIF